MVMTAKGERRLPLIPGGLTGRNPGWSKVMPEGFGAE
jgi:hypothetical protein